MDQLNIAQLGLLSHRKRVIFALFCAKQVISLVPKEHKYYCDKTIKTIENWLDGKATNEECDQAAGTTYNIASAYAPRYAYDMIPSHAASASHNAIYTIADAAYTVINISAYATYTTVSAASHAVKAVLPTYRDRVIEKQWDFYNELLNEDALIEEALRS